MISFVRGRLAAKSGAHAVVEVGGVGLRVAMSNMSLADLPTVGDEVTVHTHLHVREDELSLFGFLSESERSLFEMLITVSGVGPKVALAVLSVLRPEALERALADEDVASLSSVPGVGKKTAQRLIIELKDRLDVPGVPTSAAGTASAASGAAAREALLSMGFSPAEASAALRSVPSDASVEEALRIALKALGGAA